MVDSENVIKVENNNPPAKKLSVFQSAAIINGCGIGAGILAIPYLANKIGIWLAILFVLVAYFGVYIIHLIIADLTIKNGKGSQMIDIIRNSKLFGKNVKVFSIVVFVLMAVVLTSDLTSYVIGAASGLADLFPMIPLWCWKMIFYVFAAIVALFGLKVLGVTEKYATILIFGTAGALIIGSMFHLDAKIAMIPQSAKDVFIFISIAMFAFNSFFSVPQVVEGLDCDKKKIRLSINLGMGFNAVVIFLIMIFCLASSSISITQVCIEGWAKSIGEWANYVGLVFTLLALFSSYWAISFSLRDIFHSQLKLNNKLCWLISTLPSLVLAIVISFLDDEKGSGFTLFISISSIVEATLIGLFVLPNFHRYRKEMKPGESIFGRFGTLIPEIIAFLTIALICVGGILEIVG